MLDKKYFICGSVKLSHFVNLLIKERLFKRNMVVLCYLNPSKTSIFLEKISKIIAINRLTKFSLLCLNYDFLRMKDRNGIPVVIASVKDDLYHVIEKMEDAESSSGESLLDHLDERFTIIKKELKSYIKQRIALDIYDDLYVVNVTHWLVAEKESELFGKNLSVLIEKKSYWIYLVLDFAKSKNLNYLVFHTMELRNFKGALFAYYLIKICFEIIISLVRGRKKGRYSSQTKVGIPFYLSQNFVNFFDLRNYYLYWFIKSGISPEKILIYAPERRFNINKEEVSNINRSGFNIILGPTQIWRNQGLKIPAHACTFKTTSLLIKYLKAIIILRKHAKSRFMKEQWKILALLFVQLPYWVDFFQSNNIKVKFRFHDNFSLREIAAKLSGAITMSYHYSNQSDMTILHQDVCDVFFVWGKKYEQNLSGRHSAIDNFIQTGYVFDYTFSNLKNKAMVLKNTFKAGNVSYIIGIFDEFVGRCFAEPQLKAYKSILEYAQKHPDIGVIIKPKKENTIQCLKSSDKMLELISDLEKQGRIRILDNRKYPAEAGQASDIVIGMVPDSTAGLECALAGIPMVIYDIFSMKNHPFYEWGYNKVIFDDIQCLLNSLNVNKEKPGSIPGFSDWSLIFDAIDPFRDGRANQRIGAYIRTLILKLDEGFSKEGAIKAVNEAYGHEFGLDKVTSIKES